MRGSLDRRIRREAAALVAEVGRALKKSHGRLGEATRAELARRSRSLDEARAAGDGERLRAELYTLDEMADQHLGFARRSSGRQNVEAIAGAILIALVLRAFVVEAFKIPSGSMIPTLEIGDQIFVNKFIYGIRLPWTTIKFFDWRRPRRGEVVVFINPCEPDKDFIKRIVAVAGDTVEVRCDVLYVNGKPVPDRLVDEECTYWDKDELTEEWSTQRCSRYVEVTEEGEHQTLHAAERPRRDRARADDPDAPYEALIGEHDFPLDRLPECPIAHDGRPEAQRARSRGRIVDARPPDLEETCAPHRHYVVPDGHVFAMGDNRDNSSDSRVWGAVPLENIKGEALFIWYARQPEHAGGKGNLLGILFERIGKLVN